MYGLLHFSLEGRPRFEGISGDIAGLVSGVEGRPPFGVTGRGDISDLLGVLGVISEGHWRGSVLLMGTGSPCLSVVDHW